MRFRSGHAGLLPKKAGEEGRRAGQGFRFPSPATAVSGCGSIGGATPHTPQGQGGATPPLYPPYLGLWFLCHFHKVVGSIVENHLTHCQRLSTPE